MLTVHKGNRDPRATDNKTDLLTSQLKPCDEQEFKRYEAQMKQMFGNRPLPPFALTGASWKALFFAEAANTMAGQLILIRGLPGSGKSTLASSFVKLGFRHYETDKFFIRSSDGKYVFDPSLLKSAHKWCQDCAENALRDGFDVVVSNTFTRIWELQPYLDMKTSRTTVLTCERNYGNIHDVPEHVIENMRKRWENF